MVLNVRLGDVCTGFGFIGWGMVEVKIGNQTPVNKTAALVTQQASIDNRYEISNLKGKLGILFWKDPRPMVSAPEGVNLVNRTFGRLRVIGFLGNKKWQCKCLCGNYTGRSQKAINNPNNNVDACEECRELAHIKREYDFRKTGKNRDIKEYY